MKVLSPSDGNIFDPQSAPLGWRSEIFESVKDQKDLSNIKIGFASLQDATISPSVSVQRALDEAKNAARRLGM
jgi:hypothetical protein